MARFGLAALLLIVASAVAAAPPAFPGAEGFGAASVGGRGGRVIKVTHLGSSGPGSFAAAAAAQGPRIVVFGVAGVIRGDVEIRYPNITIAGESAPAPGITLEGRLRALPARDERLHDVIVRFLRIRPPRQHGAGGDALQLPKSDRVIIDHVSLSWANDELIDIIHSADVTVQWCTLEESDPYGHAKGEGHNYGLISAYPGSGNVSIHHNLFAHQSRRSPSLSPQAGPAEFRNNVVYNFSQGLTHDGHTPRAPIYLIGNYYKRGPSAWRIRPFEFKAEASYYLAGNFIEGLGELGEPRRDYPGFRPWLRLRPGGGVVEREVGLPGVATDSAATAYRHVLERAGAFPRDRVTRRTIDEVRRGEGGWGRHAPPRPSDEWFLLDLSTEAPVPDGDGDGMDDRWEREHGLDPRDSTDHARVLDSGYTAIEAYLDQRARLLLARRHGAQP